MSPVDEKLTVLVPSRGRPESVRRMVKAFTDTNAYEVARLVYLIDADDPLYEQYHRQVTEEPQPFGPLVEFAHFSKWQPMVQKLNEIAALVANTSSDAIAFLGDDHIPRTNRWAQIFLEELRKPGTLVVYGDDTIQGAKLPTHWAVSTRWVRTLGEMVPLDVEHLYCDNAMLELGTATDSIRYLPEVVIEHMHPIAGKSEWDPGYRHVNRPEQYRRDRQTYRQWLTGREIVQQIDRLNGIDWG